jgi:hypothetical protein
MRAFLATKSADRISTCVLSAAGGLCGVLVFFVAVPLASSSPYPTPKDGAWLVQRPTFELASVTSMPVVIEPPLTLNAEAFTPEDLEPPTVKEASLVPVSAEAASSLPAKLVDPETTGSIGKPTAPVQSPLRRPVSVMDEVDEYLWEVYQRAPTKKDSTGDFTWKDPAAAKRVKMTLHAYTIGGMDPDFREQLYHAGRAMDAAGIRWSMLSAFRDDYRQALASGFKARPGNSLHGGSRAVGGYGHGRAIDITSAEGNHSAVWHWIDGHGAKYGLIRPMPGADPAHVQPRGTWHNIAVALRVSRAGTDDVARVASADESVRIPAGKSGGRRTRVASHSWRRHRG